MPIEQSAAERLKILGLEIHRLLLKLYGEEDSGALIGALTALSGQLSGALGAPQEHANTLYNLAYKVGANGFPLELALNHLCASGEQTPLSQPPPSAFAHAFGAKFFELFASALPRDLPQGAHPNDILDGLALALSHYALSSETSIVEIIQRLGICSAVVKSAMMEDAVTPAFNQLN